MDNATMTDARLRAARTTLADRMAALEDRVTGTIETARSTVDDTAATVRNTVADVTGNVRGMVSDVSGNVRGLMGSASENIGEVLDIRKKMREHPLQGTLIAIGAGLAAWLATRPRSSAAPRVAFTSESATPAGPFGEIYTAFRKELVSVGETAAHAAAQMLKDNVQALTSPTREYERDRREMSNAR